MGGETKKRLLLSKYEALRERVSDLQDEIEELKEGVDAYSYDLEAVLVDAKYWLLDVTVHGRPLQVTPRAMLRRIEEVLCGQ